MVEYRNGKISAFRLWRHNLDNHFGRVGKDIKMQLYAKQLPNNPSPDKKDTHRPQHIDQKNINSYTITMYAIYLIHPCIV